MLVLDQANGSAKVTTPVIEDRRIDVGELAESRLRRNGYFALRNVSCRYHDGVVTLHGHLPTYYLKQLAQEVVAKVRGVTKIVNQIDVE